MSETERDEAQTPPEPSPPRPDAPVIAAEVPNGQSEQEWSPTAAAAWNAIQKLDLGLRRE
jgi:hypothetical protein